MDMLAQLSFSTEWGLDLMDQPSFPFGDLKEESRLIGDMDPARKPGDAVEQLAQSPSQEESLGYEFEWMESGDLGSFLDALDNGQDKMLPLEDNFLDCSPQDIGLKVDFIQPEMAAIPSFLSNNEMGKLIQGLTPPESPEQVTPVIKLEPEPVGDLTLSNSQHLIVSSSLTPVEFQSTDFLLEENLQSQHVFDPSEILGFTFATRDVATFPDHVAENADISFSVSTDEGSSILSSPEESPKQNIESIIKSSPELYKVIATPSNLSARFSPYGKVKGESKVKSESKGGKCASPESMSDDEMFPSHLGKKERKKLQNKNAAIRYRQKKKMEVQCIVTEVQDLEDRNHELKTKVDDLQREVKYMKSLMEDIYKAKGLK